MSGTANSNHERTAKAVSATSVDEATVRDRVWDATIELLAQRPIPFQAWRIRKRAGLARTNDRTIRRTLKSMEEMGWLSRENDGDYRYREGPKYEEIQP